MYYIQNGIRFCAACRCAVPETFPGLDGMAHFCDQADLHHASMEYRKMLVDICDSKCAGEMEDHIENTKHELGMVES